MIIGSFAGTQETRATLSSAPFPAAPWQDEADLVNDGKTRELQMLK